MRSNSIASNSFRALLLTGGHTAWVCLVLLLAVPGNLFSQVTVYDNFDGVKWVRYDERSGTLDTLAKNPKPDSVNKSKQCARYVRSGTRKFDNIKMQLPSNLMGVNAYATYNGVPPTLKMKLYTNAPVGTLVEILLGRKSGNNDYPAGTNSQYQVYTTVANKWEELEFKFSQVPQGSETSFSQIDQVTLLFSPNSSSSDTYYFDEITGPPINNVKPGKGPSDTEVLDGLDNKKVNSNKHSIEK